MRTCLRIVTVPAISGFRSVEESTASLSGSRGAPFLPSPSAPPPLRKPCASGWPVLGWDPPAQVRRAGTACELSRFPQPHPPPHSRRSAHSGVRPAAAQPAPGPWTLPGSLTGAPIGVSPLHFPSPSTRSVLPLAFRVLSPAPVEQGCGGLGLPPNKACCLYR